MTDAQAALLLATKNRAITRCWLSHTSYGQVAAATCGLLWPIGTVVAGPWGILAMGGFAGVLLITSVLTATQEADAIELGAVQGNYAKLGEYLTPDDVLDLKRQAIATGVIDPEKKMSPNLGQPATTSGNGTSTPSAGSPVPLPQKPVQLDDAAPHLFLVGRTREGKSETLKYLIGDQPRVWYVTSKVTDQVPEHWQGYRVGGPKLPEQIQWLLQQWEAAFLRHLDGSDTQREWFVIDEVVGILKSLQSKGAKDVADRLRAFVIEGVTAGAAVHALVGLLSQTGNSGPLGIDLDLLQNFSIVACGKRKKPQMLAHFTKLTGLRVPPEQEEAILALDGYWQLWEDDGPCLSQVPCSPLPLKAVECCPTRQAEATQPPQPPPTKSLETRILQWLARQTKPKAAWEIRNYCTDKSNPQRPDVPAIKAVLAAMVTQQQIQCTSTGKTAKYRVAGTEEARVEGDEKRTLGSSLEPP